MNFLREKQSCRYFLFLLGTGLLLMLAALGLCFLHAAEVQQVLLERERTVTAALLDQGVPGPVLAAAPCSHWQSRPVRPCGCAAGNGCTRT